MNGMSVDLSEFEAYGKQHGPRCSIARALQDLPPDEAVRFAAALAAERIPSSNIARWLVERGFAVKGRTVSRHRSGECSCV